EKTRRRIWLQIGDLGVGRYLGIPGIDRFRATPSALSPRLSRALGGVVTTPALAGWLGFGVAGGGFAVGLFGGIVSGLLGVSPGGILVPGLALVLGITQHRAQGISLVAQLLPAGLPGVMEYHRKGHRVRWRSVLVASLGFLVGAYGGARLAGGIPERPLR